MERGRILGVVLLAAVTAGAIGYAASRQAEERAAEEAAYQAYLDALPLAEAEGETCSPNGRFQVRTAGESDLWISGVRIPEALEIVDTETGEVRWEGEPSGPLEREESRKPWISRPSALFRDMRFFMALPAAEGRGRR